MSSQSGTNHSWFLSDDELSTVKDADGLPLIEPTEQALQRGKNNPNSSTYMLRIGKIFRGHAELKSSEAETESPRIGVTNTGLDPGGMAIVETLETVNMPHNCVGIVFGTNTVTSKGLLLLNPGFITAGHRSHIRFFVVNFGKDKFDLYRDQQIARLLVLRHPAGNHPGDRLPDYKREHHSDVQENLYRDISYLMSERINEAVGKNLRKIIANHLKAHDLSMRKRQTELDQDIKRLLKEVQEDRDAALKVIQEDRATALKDVYKRMGTGILLTVIFTTLLAIIVSKILP